MSNYELWSVLYCPDTRTRAALPAIIERLQPHVLLLAAEPGNLAAHGVNILAPRGPGSLAAWLSVWLDTPAQGVLWLDMPAALPDKDTLLALSACHGRQRVMAAGQQNPFPAYFHRSCLGAGQRLYQQGQRQLPVLLKLLKAPFL